MIACLNTGHIGFFVKVGAKLGNVCVVEKKRANLIERVNFMVKEKLHGLIMVGLERENLEMVNTYQEHGF